MVVCNGAALAGAGVVAAVACWLALQGLSGGRQQKPTRLGTAVLPPVKLSLEALEEYNRTGYVVVRGALPSWVVKELYAAARRAYPHYRPDVTIKGPGDGTWWFAEHQPWMDLDELADLVLHRDAPLGSLAAQLMGAEEVRVGQDSLRGTSTAAPGRSFHLDNPAHGFDCFAFPPRGEPVTNMFLVLSDQAINANDTGGSLAVVPSDRFWEVGASPCAAPGGGSQADWLDDPQRRACKAWLEARSVTLDIALGDVVFYSSSIPHRSQPMRRGDRLSYVARFTNVDGLPGKLVGYPACKRLLHTCDGTQVMAFDRLGLYATCGDLSQGVHEYDLLWPSVYTFGITKSTSACKPRVAPRPLEHELAARRAGLVQNFLASGSWRQVVKDHPMLPKMYNKVMQSWAWAA